MTGSKRYWFRQKRFGYGATPNSWQGWVTILVTVALVLAVVLGAKLLPGHAIRLAFAATGLVIVIVPALLISQAKTEGGWRWRWGGK